MSEMIERVAEALTRDGFARLQSLQTKDEDAYQAWREKVWPTSLAAARAAIAAMREPTESMVAASDREWDGRMSHRSTGAWQAMIDEALKESP